jgi:carbonic anhydrase
MEVHLVHADQEGKAAVVAVLLQKGEDNPLVHELWNDLPRKRKRRILEQRPIALDSNFERRLAGDSGDDLPGVADQGLL